MSNPLEPNPPTFASLVPAMPEFVAICKVDAALAGALGGTGEWLAMSGTTGGEISYFRFVPASGGEAIFVKVIPASRIAAELADDAMARSVHDKGVAARVMLPGYPLTLDDGRAVCGYPFIEGEFAAPSRQEMESLGQGLGRLHGALKDCGADNEVRDLSQVRMSIIKSGYAKLCANPDHPMWRWCHNGEGWEPDFELAALPRQIIHGDLNRANVLFPNPNGRPVFLDFEDSRMSWLPPICDIAFVVERFALVVDGGGEVALRLATAFLNGYRDTVGKQPIARHGLLAEILRMLAIRSLSLLAAKSSGCTIAPIGQEETKFIDLLALHARSKGFLAALEERYVS
jgi:Ser/Thr protein kinase RdoA (MazF antagonist)